jgi:hypothetical protein
MAFPKRRGAAVGNNREQAAHATGYQARLSWSGPPDYSLPVITLTLGDLPVQRRLRTHLGPARYDAWYWRGWWDCDRKLQRGG